jgi:hypothetical protein
MVYCVSNRSKTDKDNAQIISRLPTVLYCANRMHYFALCKIRVRCLGVPCNCKAIWRVFGSLLKIGEKGSGESDSDARPKKLLSRR